MYTKTKSNYVFVHLFVLYNFTKLLTVFVIITLYDYRVVINLTILIESIYIADSYLLMKLVEK